MSGMPQTAAEGRVWASAPDTNLASIIAMNAQNGGDMRVRIGFFRMRIIPVRRVECYSDQGLEPRSGSVRTTRSLPRLRPLYWWAIGRLRHRPTLWAAVGRGAEVIATDPAA